LCLIVMLKASFRSGRFYVGKKRPSDTLCSIIPS
jgi:hypothetical protein